MRLKDRYTRVRERFDPPRLLLCTDLMLNEEAKERLRQNLDKVHEWPSVYMFKFIFEPEAERLAAVVGLFPPEIEVLRKYSSGGKYLSLTIKEVMMNAEEVVKRYDRAAAITGVIIL